MSLNEIIISKLPRPIFNGKKFSIPWENEGLISRWTAFKWGMFRPHFKFPTLEEIHNNPFLAPRTINPKDLISETSNELNYTWIIHSSAFLSVNKFNILTDPFFSRYTGPLIIRLLGKHSNCYSYSSIPLMVETLPKVDIITISHDHYDHLDKPSVEKIYERFGDDLLWVTPLKYKDWFGSLGIKNLVELNWWDTVQIKREEGKSPTVEKILIMEDSDQGKNGTNPYNDNEHPSEIIDPKELSSLYSEINFTHTDKLLITLYPSQHWCSRTSFDVNERLWGSWAFKSKNFKFTMMGDTGYCDMFSTVGDVLGPFDLAGIPIGAYEPRYIMKNAHVNPEEAVKIHQDLRSKKSFGIHWGSFHFSDEGFFEPPDALRNALISNKDYLNVDFTVKELGKTYVLRKEDL